MKLVRMGIGLVLAAALAACGTPAVIKSVEDKKVEALSSADTTKPIQFKKVVVKLKRGEHIGAMQAGVFCVSQGDLTWKGGRLNVDSDEFTDAFKDELEKYAFKAVGDPNALFEDPTSWKAEILVAGLVKELKANICFPGAGWGNFSSSKGEAFLKVEWQIYSRLDRSVVHTVSTEGSYKVDSASAGGDTAAVINAFAQAARNLLSDPQFRKIVSQGGRVVKDTTFKSGDRLLITTSTSRPAGAKPAEWTDAVVTVFAGQGHGSGFVISDNLILTNQHVVGESNAVAVKFHNGMQLTGKVIAANSGRDVALVKVDASLPVRLRVARALPSVGTDVFAIGSPLDEALESTVSKGIVSGLREMNNKRFLQSDVNIRPGNSGGPLVDINGAVVGIAVSGLVVNNDSQGINFFIPIDDALNYMGVSEN